MSENIRKAILIGIVVVLAIVLGGVLFWKNSQAPSESARNSEDTNSSNEQQEENQPTNTVELPDPKNVSTRGWKTYTASDLNFRIEYPPQAEVSSPQPNIRRIRFLGEDNTEGSEITDGFTVTVSQDQDATQYSSLGTYGQETIANLQEKPEQELVNDQGITSIGEDGEAYVYSARTALGNVTTTYLFLPNNVNQGYNVSVSVQDPNQNGYDIRANRMVSTLEFTQ